MIIKVTGPSFDVLPLNRLVRTGSPGRRWWALHQRHSLSGKEVTGTTKLAVTNNLFCIVNRHTLVPCTSMIRPMINATRKTISTSMTRNHRHLRVERAGPFLTEGLWQAGKDTHHDDNRSTITKPLSVIHPATLRTMYPTVKDDNGEKPEIVAESGNDSFSLPGLFR